MYLASHHFLSRQWGHFPSIAVFKALPGLHLSSTPGESMLKRDRQGCQTPKAQIFSPGYRTRLQTQLGHPAQHRLERDLALESCEWGSEAEVSTPCKREMPIILAADIQPIRVGEPLWITVCGTHHCYHCLALPKRFPLHLHV